MERIGEAEAPRTAVSCHFPGIDKGCRQPALSEDRHDHVGSGPLRDAVERERLTVVERDCVSPDPHPRPTQSRPGKGYGFGTAPGCKSAPERLNRRVEPAAGHPVHPIGRRQQCQGIRIRPFEPASSIQARQGTVGVMEAPEALGATQGRNRARKSPGHDVGMSLHGDRCIGSESASAPRIPDPARKGSPRERRRGGDRDEPTP